MLELIDEGDGPTVVLVHGVAGGKHIFDALAPLLEAQFRVVRPDLLGYGESPKPVGDYTPSAHVEAVRATLATLEVPPPYHLVGLSMGTAIVLDWAARYPGEVGLVAGLGFPYYPDEAAARAGLAHNFWTRLSIEHGAAARVLTPLAWGIGRHLSGFASRTSAVYTPVMAEEALSCRYLAFRRSLEQCLLYNRPEAALAAGAERPRLFVHGSEDRWSSVAQVAAVLEPYELTRFAVIDGVEHNVAVLAAEQTAELLVEFFTGEG